MKTAVIDPNTIYVPSTPTPEPVYCYIRGYRGSTVGFSALDYLSSAPDFSYCGIFWIRKNDFQIMFRPYKADRRNLPC